MPRNQNMIQALDNLVLDLRTPWGKPLRSTMIEPGFMYVMAPHGRGLMCRQMWARNNLSEAARDRAAPYDRLWLCYGEKWEWMMVALELYPLHWSMVFENFADDLQPSEPPPEYLRRRLSLDAADYLEARGITPIPALASRWRRRFEREHRVAQGDPQVLDRMTGGEWRTGKPDVAEIKTADGSRHYVTLASLEAADPDLVTLDQLVVVERPKLVT
jgi:hypothetical protein